MSRVAIIGSGLAAMSVARALIKKGIKPIILDCGEALPAETQAVVDRMSSIPTEQWSNEDKEIISANTTIEDKNSLPQKLAFGSGYFYGAASKVFEDIKKPNNPLPPFSLARGGFSAGWGGAVLPADDCDLIDWPITSKNLKKYYEATLAELPYSACDDALAEHFPLYATDYDSINLTTGNASLLSAFKNKKHKLQKMHAVAGQARLLTRASNTAKRLGCQYCGYCMSGCVYGAIYKASLDLDDFIKNDLVDYESDVFVNYLTETNNEVVIHFTDKNNKNMSLSVKRVFLAAGAVGSARIIMQSKNIYQEDVQLISTIGFIAPLLKFKGSNLAWPHINTQPGVFLEYKVPNLSDHWVHAQISTANELALQKLGLLTNNTYFSDKMRKKAVEYLLFANCNMHSTHGVSHTIRLQKDNMLTAVQGDNQHAVKALKLAKRRLFSVARTAGCYVLLPFVQSGVGFASNHLGGSLPMKHHPIKETDTNIWGSPKGWSRTHVVDSSVFPTIPGTTIGLLAMANAKRIVDSVENWD
jgi:choline dehydrogenase-like flavoprotein